MIVSSFFAISLMFAITSGKPVTRSMQVHESIQKLPTGFAPKGLVSPDEMLNLRIVLVQNDPAGLVDKLMDISSPTSANYGHWLSREEVRSMLGLSSNTCPYWLTLFGTDRALYRPFVPELCRGYVLA